MWQHQQDAIQWLATRGGGILHHGMGSGKSRTTIEYLHAQQDASRVLICCPKAVMPAWGKQFGLWGRGRFRVVLLDQSTKERKIKALRHALADTTPLVIVVNYDSAWRLKELEKIEFDTIVWDEVHRLKSPSGRASRWAARMCANTDGVVIGLTGTLIPHSILDAMAIYRAVESPECPTFGDSIVRHRLRYAVENPNQRGMVLGWRNLEEAHAKIKATTHYVRTRDVIDLPPIRFLTIPVTLTPEEHRLYSQLSREFVAVVEAGTITAANALTQLLRLQQITGGCVRFDERDNVTQISENPAKQAALADMLEDLPADEPVVIFCRFTSDIRLCRLACERLGRGSSELSGQRNELAEWQDGRTPVLVAQIQSGGIGIDLTRASYGVFFSLGYSLAEYEQAVARLHRPGQTAHTTIYHLVATSTVDCRVYDCLRERKNVVGSIIDGIKSAKCIV